MKLNEIRLVDSPYNILMVATVGELAGLEPQSAWSHRCSACAGRTFELHPRFGSLIGLAVPEVQH